MPLLLRLLAVLSLAAWVVPAQAQQLTIASQYKRGADARDRAIRIFIEEVGLRAPELKLEIVPSDPAARPPGQFAALQQGKVELAVFPLTYGSEAIPELALTGLAGLVPGIAAAAKLKGSAMHRKLQEVAEANGVHILTWWWVHGGLVSSKTLLKGPAAVKGLKAAGDDRSFNRMLTAAGASVEVTPASGVGAALKAGAVDVFAASYESLMASQSYDAAPFATLGGWTIWSSFSPLLINKVVWDKLTPAEQETMVAAAEVSDGFFEGSQMDAELRVVNRFKAAHAEVYSLTPDEWEAWVSFAQETTWLEYLKVSPTAAELLRATLLKIMEDDREPSKDAPAAGK